MTIYYVDAGHASRSDSNAGTSESLPWATVQKAASVSFQPNDRIRIKNGTYTGSTATIVTSGTALGQVYFEAYPGHTPLLKFGFSITGKSYLTIQGLKLFGNASEGGGGAAISSKGKVSAPIAKNIGIQIIGNHFYDWKEPGILAHSVDWGTNPGVLGWNGHQQLYIAYNKFQKCCNGGYNECCSVYGGCDGLIIEYNEVWGFDTEAERLAVGANAYSEPGHVALFGYAIGTNGGEGIDPKGGIKNWILRFNNVHDLHKLGFYPDAALAQGSNTTTIVDMENGQIYGNTITNTTDSALQPVCEGSGSFRGLDIYNNTINGVTNSKHGVLIYKHNPGFPMTSPIVAPLGTFYQVGIYLNTTASVSGSRYRVDARLLTGSPLAEIDFRAPGNPSYPNDATLTQGTSYTAITKPFVPPSAAVTMAGTIVAPVPGVLAGVTVDPVPSVVADAVIVAPVPGVSATAQSAGPIASFTTKPFTSKAAAIAFSQTVMTRTPGYSASNPTQNYYRVREDLNGLAVCIIHDTTYLQVSEQTDLLEEGLDTVSGYPAAWVEKPNWRDEVFNRGPSRFPFRVLYAGADALWTGSSGRLKDTLGLKHLTEIPATEWFASAYASSAVPAQSTFDSALAETDTITGQPHSEHTHIASALTEWGDTFVNNDNDPGDWSAQRAKLVTVGDRLKRAAPRALVSNFAPAIPKEDFTDLSQSPDLAGYKTTQAVNTYLRGVPAAYDFIIPSVPETVLTTASGLGAFTEATFTTYVNFLLAQVREARRIAGSRKPIFVQLPITYSGRSAILDRKWVRRLIQELIRQDIADGIVIAGGATLTYEQASQYFEGLADAAIEDRYGALTNAVTRPAFASSGRYALVSTDGYTGNVLTISRISDNATMDVALVDGRIDNDAILLWANADVVRVRTWWDQSSFVRPLTAAAALIDSPLYIPSIGGISFDPNDPRAPVGTNCRALVTDQPGSSVPQPYFMAVNARQIAGQTGPMLVHGTVDSTLGITSETDGRITVRATSGGLSFSKQGIPDGWNAIATQFNGSSSYLVVNGQVQTGTLNASNWTVMHIGGYDAGFPSGNQFEGVIDYAEFVNGLVTQTDAQQLARWMRQQLSA